MSLKKSLNISLYILVFCSSVLNAQNTKNKEIDLLITKTTQLQMDGSDDDALKNSEQLLKFSETSNNEKGLAYGYFFLASYYNDVAKFKESIWYANKAQKNKSYLAEDKTQSAKISALLGTNYLLLELYSLSLKNYQETLKTINSIPNKNITDSLTESSTYSHLSYLYENKNMYDSMYYFLNKEKNILKKVNYKDAYIEKGCSCLGLGNYHFNLNTIDSANFYYNHSIFFFKDKKHPCKIESYIGLANTFAAKQDFTNAEKYYQLALKSFDSKTFPDILCNLYEKIADMYISKEDPIQAKKYQTLYLNLKKDLDIRKKKERDDVLNDVMQKAEEEHDNSLKRTKYITIGIFSVLAIITFYIIYLLINSFKKHKKTLEITKILTSEKELQEKETGKLKLQINDAFEEVIHLAKENSPEFFTRFQEVYPNFTTKMLNINPKFRATELTFSAYLYLGFTTKEIADYTFKALKTIENNRYNLRKKLGLTPELDLQIWLRNYIDAD